MVTARFQSHIGCRTTRQFSRRAQGMNFGMGFTGSFVPACADNLVLSDQHTTDTRIGRGRVQPAFGKTQRPSHPLTVGSVHFLSL
jgi:hypothetical protein